jgi:acyl-CoA synthetase (AMP-forming)/AMP-acid ligase II
LADDKLKPCLEGKVPAEVGRNNKVAYLTQRDATYALGQFGSWAANACGLPLATSSTKSQIEYMVRDSQASVVLCNPEFKHLFKDLPSKMDNAP